MTVEPGATVWVLDLVGYDARGGNAMVFATVEEAKAHLPDVTWKPTDYWNAAAVAWKPGGWEQKVRDGSVEDIKVIYPAVVNEADGP